VLVLVLMLLPAQLQVQRLPRQQAGKQTSCAAAPAAWELLPPRALPLHLVLHRPRQLARQQQLPRWCAGHAVAWMLLLVLLVLLLARLHGCLAPLHLRPPGAAATQTSCVACRAAWARHQQLAGLLLAPQQRRLWWCACRALPVLLQVLLLVLLAALRHCCCPRGGQRAWRWCGVSGAAALLLR
jgi:hypothetical protein